MNTTCSNASNAWQGASGAQRPDRAQLAQRLFQQLDTSGQGYLSKADLQSALDRVTLSKEGRAAATADGASSASASSTTSSSVDALMAKLDTDGDGKVTEQEFANALANAAPPAHGPHGHHAHGSHGARSAEAGGQGGDHDGDGDDAAAGAAATASSATAANDTDNDSARAVLQVMRLLRAYHSSDPVAQAQVAGSTQATAPQGVSATA